MAVKVKKKVKAEKAGPQPGNPLAEPNPKVEKWRNKSKKLFLVELVGVDQSAVVPADNKSEAKDRFLTLFGINSTDRTIKATEVDDDHGFAVDCNGIVDHHFGKRGTRGGRPKQDDDNEDDDE